MVGGRGGLAIIAFPCKMIKHNQHANHANLSNLMQSIVRQSAAITICVFCGPSRLPGVGPNIACESSATSRCCLSGFRQDTCDEETMIGNANGLLEAHWVLRYLKLLLTNHQPLQPRRAFESGGLSVYLLVCLAVCRSMADSINLFVCKFVGLRITNWTKGQTNDQCSGVCPNSAWTDGRSDERIDGNMIKQTNERRVF